MPRLALIARAEKHRRKTPAQQRVVALSQWFTEPWLADHLAEIANITPRTRVLEPSAGDGELVRAALDRRAEVVDAVEYDAGVARRLERRFRGRACAVHRADFLAWQKIEIRYDVALQNPPYEGGQDLAHLWHALSMSRRVVAILRLNALAGSKRFHALWSRVDLRQVLVLPERPDFGREARRVGLVDAHGRSPGAESDFVVVDILSRSPTPGARPSFSWIRRPT